MQRQEGFDGLELFTGDSIDRKNHSTDRRDEDKRGNESVENAYDGESPIGGCRGDLCVDVADYGDAVQQGWEAFSQDFSSEIQRRAQDEKDEPADGATREDAELEEEEDSADRPEQGYGQYALTCSVAGSDTVHVYGLDSDRVPQMLCRLALDISGAKPAGQASEA